MPTDPTTLNNLASQYAAAVVACQAASQAASAAANGLANAHRAAAGIAIPKPGASTADIVAIAAAQANLARAKSTHDTAVANAASAQTAQHNAWSALLAAS